jgi:TetR/AcrR family transcriptional repressor of nem operon
MSTDIEIFDPARYSPVGGKAWETTVGITKQKAAENREAIVTAADGLFRERGVDAVGLNELMGAAGLTRGGFYNHFASKDALVDTVLAEAMAEGVGNLDRAITAAQARGSDPLTERIGWYLSPEHRADIEHGCPATASGARGQSHCSARWPAHCSSHVPSPTATPTSPTKSAARIDLHNRTGATR